MFRIVISDWAVVCRYEAGAGVTRRERRSTAAPQHRSTAPQNKTSTQRTIAT